MARVTGDHDVTPEALIDFVSSSCTAAELETLETIALAEPISETALLARLDDGAVQSLFERGLIVSTRQKYGGDEVSVAHPLLSAAVRARISPARRARVQLDVYEVLRSGVPAGGLPPDSESLLRIVEFGLHSGSVVPTPLLQAAFAVLRHGLQDPGLTIAISQQLLRRDDASFEVACEAAAAQRRLARFMTNGQALGEAITFMQEVLETRPHDVPGPLNIVFRAAILEERWWEGRSSADTVADLTDLAEDAEIHTPEMIGFVEIVQGFFLAASGESRRAFAAVEHLSTVDGHNAQGTLATMHMARSTILNQRGRVRESIAAAEQASRTSIMGDVPRLDLYDMSRFSVLLGYLVSGSSEAGMSLLREYLEDPVHGQGAHHRVSLLLETATILFATADGRWHHAAQYAQGVLDRLVDEDNYGVSTLVQAAAALALAALDERDEAIRLLNLSSTI